MSFDRAEFELRRETFEEIIAPELTPEQRLYFQRHEQLRATCPCCGYPTINGRGFHEICPLCKWEDDGQDDAGRRTVPLDPDAVAGGANGDYSLAEARENFAESLTMYRPTDRDFEAERSRTDVKRRVTELYDAAVNGDMLFHIADEEARYLLNDRLME